jgi:hypothetical protein
MSNIVNSTTSLEPTKIFKVNIFLFKFFLLVKRYFEHDHKHNTNTIAKYNEFKDKISQLYIFQTNKIDIKIKILIKQIDNITMESKQNISGELENKQTSEDTRLYDYRDIELDMTEGFSNSEIFLSTKKRSNTLNRRFSKVSKIFKETMSEDTELTTLVDMKVKLYSNKKLIDM